jgi:hypothetical protein
MLRDTSIRHSHAVGKAERNLFMSLKTRGVVDKAQRGQRRHRDDPDDTDKRRQGGAERKLSHLLTGLLPWHYTV